MGLKKWEEALFDPLLIYYSNCMRFILHSKLKRLIPMHSNYKSNLNGWLKAYLYIYEHRLSFLFNPYKNLRCHLPINIKGLSKEFLTFPPRQNQNNTCEQGGRRVKVIFPMWLECFLWTTKTLHLGFADSDRNCLPFIKLSG